MSLIHTSIIILVSLLALMCYLLWGLYGMACLLLLLVSAQGGLYLYNRMAEKRLQQYINRMSDREFAEALEQLSPELRPLLQKQRKQHRQDSRKPRE